MSEDNGLTVVIQNTTANAGIQILNSSGGVIASSTTGGAGEEVIWLTNNNIGTYYVRIYPVGNANTNYDLNLVPFSGLGEPD